MVISNTDSNCYKEARTNLGHNFVVRFDNVREGCMKESHPTGNRTFALWKEDYGDSWILYSRLPDEAPDEHSPRPVPAPPTGQEPALDSSAAAEDPRTSSVVRCYSGCRCAEPLSTVLCDCAGAQRQCNRFSCLCGNNCQNRL
eukprot:GHVU01077623.1.p2 GENE.GHVU01077623.1~~GHVU01077623.1.p2  ORF type:complete len:143 (+),score=9.72 GHVU01077623.1:329-757(+)